MVIKRIIHANSLSRYLTIGSLAFGIDYGVLLLTYYVFGAPLALATTLGYAIGFGVSFTSNRRWVFGESGKQRHVGRQGMEYIILVIFNYGVTVLGVRYLNEQGVRPYIGKILIMALIVCWNYLLFKKVIFAETKSTAGPPA